MFMLAMKAERKPEPRSASLARTNGVKMFLPLTRFELLQARCTNRLLNDMSSILTGRKTGSPLKIWVAQGPKHRAVSQLVEVGRSTYKGQSHARGILRGIC